MSGRASSLMRTPCPGKTSTDEKNEFYSAHRNHKSFPENARYKVRIAHPTKADVFADKVSRCRVRNAHLDAVRRSDRLCQS